MTCRQQIGFWMRLGLPIFTLMFFFASYSVSAQKIEKKFLGQFLSVAAPAYLVLKDVNVRKAPITKSSRVGRFRKGARISVAGKAKGTNWIAVRKDGKDFGFVYAVALAPVLDGSILVPVKGKLSGMNLPSCNYIIQYEGRKKVKGDIQIISDYAASISCNLRGKKIEFMANMFMTELPYRDLGKDIFQVNVDLPKVTDNEEEIMSVTSLFDFAKKELAFEAVTIDRLARAKPGNTKKVEKIPAVLTAALEFAHEVWGDGVWKILEKAK